MAEHNHNDAWSQRVALVTGAGRGIGRVTARTLAARGDRVMAVARTESELARSSRRPASPTWSRASRHPRAVPGSSRRPATRLGPIDILVNNAGMLSDRERAIWEMDPQVWHEVFAINLHGPFELIRRASRDMIAAGAAGS